MNPPAFQFYAADYLADANVQLMSLEEEGAYIRLLAFCWREGSIPSDEAVCSRLCKGASTTVVRVVQARFTKCLENGSRLTHKRLDDERKKQLEWREKSALGGRKSAATRKGKKQLRQTKGGSTKGQPARFNQKATLQSSSSSSKLIPLPLLEIKGFAAEWEHFVDHRKKKGAPMTDHAQELFLSSLQERPGEAVDAVKTAIMRNWTGFKWAWFDRDKNEHANDKGRPAESTRNLGTRNQGIAGEYANAPGIIRPGSKAGVPDVQRPDTRANGTAD